MTTKIILTHSNFENIWNISQNTQKCYIQRIQ